MKNNKSLFTLSHCISSVFMLLALLWLTVSIPFIYADQQAKKEMAKQQQLQGLDEENDGGVSNSSEEKSESGVNALSEYLHEFHLGEQISSTIVKFYKCHPTDLYFAFHPELISPPPDLS